MRFTVYAILDPRDAAIRYVGITVRPIRHRLSSHISQAKTDIASPTSDFIRELLSCGRKPSVVEIENTDDKYREDFWISHFKDSGCRLTNISSGGSTRGVRLTDSQKAALSVLSLGRKMPDDAKRRISESLTGRKLSDECKNKIRLAHIGKSLSIETRRRQSASLSGKKWTQERRNNMKPENLARRFITANGETKSLTEWSSISGLKPTTIFMRINSYKWSPEDAVNKPAARRGGV